MMPRQGGDDGMATVTAVGLAAVVSAAAVVGVLLAGAVAARHRAGAAADFAAIAAAQHAVEGTAAACRSAAQIARSDGARLEMCRLAGTTAEVRVRVELPGPLARLGPARATARAGPVAAGN
jgi:secretion/DNA translocation related TadE-like protein